jgi:RNA polymerase sigma factor (sigma-70 family)
LAEEWKRAAGVLYSPDKHSLTYKPFLYSAFFAVNSSWQNKCPMLWRGGNNQEMVAAKDMDLVREYADRNSEPAFAELVRRHVNLVYSVALRFTGNSGDAQDVTQAAFILLAVKAKDLRPGTILTGWLYETTRFTARKCLRTRLRQQARDQEAFMQSALNQATPDDAWKQLAPLLEEAMSRLNEKERTLLVLRFFENKTGAETAALLGIQEWAAHKRVNRAVEKLRGFFARRGVVLAAGILTAAISTNSVQAAPSTLAKTATVAALAKGATASSSILTLSKGALKIMLWTKAKTVIVASVVILLAAGTTTVVVKINNDRPLVVEGKTEQEWIDGIVYRGGDDQTQLWHSLGPKGIQMLVHALKTPVDEQDEKKASRSRQIRMNAGSLLGDLASLDPKSVLAVKSVVPDLINLMESRKNERDQRVRGMELNVFYVPIQSMDDKEKAKVVPMLLDAMQSAEAEVRNNALAALQYCSNQKETVVPVVIKALQDPEPIVRTVAVMALNKLDPENPAHSQDVAVLVGCLNAPPDRFVSAAEETVMMLGQLHREPDLAVPALIKCLESNDEYLRANSAAVLGKFGNQAKPATAALTKALEDSNANVRRQAAAALARINSDAP